jgi:hypothetical protein
VAVLAIKGIAIVVVDNFAATGRAGKYFEQFFLDGHGFLQSPSAWQKCNQYRVETAKIQALLNDSQGSPPRGFCFVESARAALKILRLLAWTNYLQGGFK